MDSAISDASRTGTQSIERAILLLRELAARGSTGWSLQDLATHCDIERATVHRILRCLVDNRLAVQRPTDKRYLIGPLNYELGLSVRGRAELADAIQHTVRAMAARLSNMTVVCVQRSGDDLVCVTRAGSASCSTVGSAIRPGQRAPILSRPSGVAIVSALADGEAIGIFERSRGRLAHLGSDYLVRAEALMIAARRQGHVLCAGSLWHGANSISMPFGGEGDPIGSLTITAGDTDHTAEALEALLPDLRAATGLLSSQAAC